MEKNIRQYFPGAITYQGYLSHWDTNLEGIDQLYILKGGPGTGKATLMRRIGKALAEAGLETELLWCSSDARSLDGVIIRDFSLAIMDGTAPHTRDPVYPGVRDMIVDLGRFWRRDILKEYRQEILSLTNENKKMFLEIYALLKKARDFAERRQSLYKIRLDEEGMEAWLDQLLKEQLVGNSIPKEPSRHRFYTIMAPQGLVSHFDELFEQAEKGYQFITDDLAIGTKVLNYIGTKAQGKGYGVWFVHDPQEPDALNAVFLPELKALYYLNGEALGDKCKTVELERWYHKNLNGRNELEAEFLLTAIEDARQRAQKLMAENKKIHDHLETYYVKAMDFTALEMEKEVLIREFLAGGGLK
ncbi:MAG: hypothetical protein AAGU12_11755 [Clostridiales bacterium]